MNFFRQLLWKWRMNRIRPGMSATEVERRLGQPNRTTRSESVEIWTYDQGRIKDMLYSIRVAFMENRVSQVYLGMEVCEDAASQEKPALQPTPEPFMEHPSGEYENAIAAMEDAIQRLRSLPKCEEWITFCAQGEVQDRPSTIAFAEIQLLNDELDVGDKPLDVALITQKASLPSASLSSIDAHYSLGSTTPREAALLFDAIFRHHFGIRPFADEDNDYAVGAEW